ncbi:Uncharacterized protein APZ42_031102 [Daphnia magna]|uniref:Uncharacterized protein n=1 Tax=Daphnia magna TaxID=35525 RepID=A0A164N524_9CRUS|nr:Uncharacterized protein APZ42_031102 [Daphnia magna]
MKYCCRMPLDTAFIDPISPIYLSTTMTSIQRIIVVALAISTNCCELYISEDGVLFEMTESISTVITVFPSNPFFQDKGSVILAIVHVFTITILAA